MNFFLTPIIAALIITTLVGCNNEKSSDTENENTPSTDNVDALSKGFEIDSINDCQSIGNFFIDETKAKDLMMHFETEYVKKGTGTEVKELSTSFWLDGCLIRSLRKFFYDSSHYDGVRIYSTLNKPIFLKNKSDVIVVPTLPGGGTHLAQWGKKVTLITDCKPKFENFNWDEKKAQGKRRDFEKDLRKESQVGVPESASVDPLSRGIWFSSCVIDSLSKYLSDPVWDLDGVYLYCAAYRKMEAPKQKHPKQSTFILVLTESDKKGGHRPRWEIISGLSWVKKKLMPNGGGYNHGELCPIDCPPGEN